MEISCIIVENEPLAMEKVKRYALRFPFLNLCGVFDNGTDALAFLKSNPVELIFLDINMGKLSGIQLLESITITAQVILTTAYQEYAIKGFDLNVTDYLLKPFTFDRFSQAIERAKSNLVKNDPTGDKKYLFVRTEYRLEKIRMDEIIYIEGMGNYRRIHLPDKKIMTLQTFKEFEQTLPADKICRVHKSFMVSCDKIDAIESNRIKIKGIYIPISETYKKVFLETIHPLKK